MSVTRRFNVRTPMRDGAELYSDLTLPAELPAPALIARTPYGKSKQAASDLGTAWASSGYVFIAQDVRGRGDSDGEWTPYVNDGCDGADTIAWAAEQEWCTGDVATIGGSYGGRIQFLTALEQPAALRAMIALVAPSDPFVENPTGLPSPMQIHWFRHVDARMPQYTEVVEWERLYAHLPLVDLDSVAGFESPLWRARLSRQTLDDYHRALCYQTRMAEIRIPVLHVSGWYDDEEIGTPLNYSLLAAHAPGQRLLMGPWGHAVNTSRQLGEVDFGPDALIDMQAYQSRWLDHHVKGVDNGEDAAAPVRIFVMGVNEWRDEAQWPPASTVETTYFLRSDGRANSRFGDGTLAVEEAGEEPPDRWTHDPARPVPFITNESSAQIGGPDDYAAIETRSDVLVYTTAELTEAMEVIGPVSLVAHVTTSGADTDVTAKLLDVHPNGFAQRLCDGVVRLRYRDGMTQALPVEPGTCYEVTVVMWDTAHVFAPGHAIRLEVSSSAFPKYARNLGTAGDQTTLAEGVIAQNEMWHTADRPSRLLLRRSS